MERGVSRPVPIETMLYKSRLKPAILGSVLEKLTIRGHILYERAVASGGNALQFAFPHMLNGAQVCQCASGNGDILDRSGLKIPLSQLPQRGSDAGHAPRDPRRMSEDDIQRAVIAHLKARRTAGTFYFAVPNGGLRNKTEAARLNGLGVLAGVPDLFLVNTGRAFALELKPPQGTLSAKQKACHESLREAGAVVAATYDLDEALATLEDWGLLRPSA